MERPALEELLLVRSSQKSATMLGNVVAVKRSTSQALVIRQSHSAGSEATHHEPPPVLERAILVSTQLLAVDEPRQLWVLRWVVLYPWVCLLLISYPTSRNSACSISAHFLGLQEMPRTSLAQLKTWRRQETRLVVEGSEILETLQPPGRQPSQIVAAVPWTFSTRADKRKCQFACIGGIEGSIARRNRNGTRRRFKKSVFGQKKCGKL